MRTPGDFGVRVRIGAAWEARSIPGRSAETDTGLAFGFPIPGRRAGSQVDSVPWDELVKHSHEIEGDKRRAKRREYLRTVCPYGENCPHAEDSCPHWDYEDGHPVCACGGEPAE